MEVKTPDIRRTRREGQSRETEELNQLPLFTSRREARWKKKIVIASVVKVRLSEPDSWRDISEFLRRKYGVMHYSVWPAHPIIFCCLKLIAPNTPVHFFRCDRISITYHMPAFFSFFLLALFGQDLLYRFCRRSSEPVWTDVCKYSIISWGKGVLMHFLYFVLRQQCADSISFSLNITSTEGLAYIHSLAYISRQNVYVQIVQTVFDQNCFHPKVKTHTCVCDATSITLFWMWEQCVNRAVTPISVIYSETSYPTINPVLILL